VAELSFTLSTGEKFIKTIEGDEAAAQAELEAFRRSGSPYGAPFFPVDDGIWLARTAVVAIAVVTNGEPTRV
jgi:hypothetical protein